jgi:adenosine deaminase
VALEICPTSYPPLGVHELDEIPVAPMLSAGVPVTLASDDPLLFGVGLAGQYLIARNELGLPDEALARIARDGIEACAAPDEVKADLFAGVNRWFG